MHGSATRLLPVAAVILLALGVFLPDWALFLATIGLAKGLVVLGLVVLWRSGLVSLGQGLFYGLGAYGVGLIPLHTGITDALVLVVAGVLMASFVSFVLGFLLRRYRAIFFAMLNLAFSMILFGILVRMEVLGSTDGFNVVDVTYFGYRPQGQAEQTSLYIFAAAVVLIAGGLTARYLNSVMGRLTTGIRDNELRVEYLGFSVARAVHFKIVLAGALAGAGGALAGIGVGHVDPEMAWWITSGEFVFVTILSGTGSVIAPFLGSIAFEALRTYALEYAPHFWQLIVGGSLLLVIMFLPGGLWSLLSRYAPERRDVGHS